MKSVVVAIASTLLFATPSLAGPKSGDDDGGGRLGQVTSGIDKATHDSSSSSSSTTRDHRSDDTTTSSELVDSGSSCCDSSSSAGAAGDWTMPDIRVDAEAFAGAQKVYDSDASLSAAFGLVFGQRVRFDAAVSHYFENEMDGDRIALTLPTFTAGIRFGALGRTRAWVEAGVAHVRTSDPAGSASITGAILGTRISHELSSDTQLLGGAGVMMFDGVRGFTGRAGVRWNHVEAAFRVLDFDVGPALYGPEIGFGF